MFNFSSLRAKNPPAQLGKCIQGVSGSRLLGVRVHRAGRTSVEWRAAPVACGGVAMDGGLQTIVQYVAAESLRNRDLVVHVDPWVLSNQDVLGALQTALPGHRFVDMNQVPPRDGNIVIRPVTSADNVIKIVAPAPTKTTTFFRVNSQNMTGGDIGFDMKGGYPGMMSCRTGQCTTGGRKKIRRASKSGKRTKPSKKSKVTKKRTHRRSKKGGQQAVEHI
jgi:hypothetical protein